jgi:hypothetical protein
MAASNYMTEADVESIWDTAWDTARFGKIGIRIAEILNFLVSGDATSQITDTSVIPILEQISEEILLDLKLAAQANAIIVPWDFISANISKIDWSFYDNYLLKKVRQKLGHTKIELVTRSLPRKTIANVIP